MEKFLVAGLGNIGAEYAGTRHNAGFDVVDELVRKYEAEFQSARLADVASIKVRGRLVRVIKPTTYMNLSGKAVKYWMDKEGIAPDHLLVIVDELAIPLSRIRLRSSGSSGGHNGLASIEESLNTREYPRLRFGIGAAYPKGRQVDFVLGRWTTDELPIVRKKIEKAAEAVESFVLRGLPATMNEVNNLEFTPDIGAD